MQRNEHVQNVVAREFEILLVVLLSPSSVGRRRNLFHMQILLEGLTASGLLIVYAFQKAI